MKITVETTPAERSIITDCPVTAARLWPHLDPKAHNAIVTLIRADTTEDNQ